MRRCIHQKADWHLRRRGRDGKGGDKYSELSGAKTVIGRQGGYQHGQGEVLKMTHKMLGSDQAE